MNVLSLFDGASCGQVALKKAGIDVQSYMACEIDKYAIEVAKGNNPEMIYVGDVTELNSSDLPNIDLLIGGSPCQSFTRSSSEGFDGKSGLFWQYARILKEVKPKYFLLENVVMKKEWMDIISNELGVEPVMIDSKHFSAQKRQRLYWTNIPIGEWNHLDGQNISEIYTGKGDIYNNKDDLMWIEDGEYRVKNATKKGYLSVENYDVVNLDFPNSKTRRGRVSKNKSNTLNTGCNQGVFLDGEIKKFSVLECERLQQFPDGYTRLVSDSQARKIIGNAWTVGVIEHIFKGLK